MRNVAKTHAGVLLLTSGQLELRNGHAAAVATLPQFCPMTWNIQLLPSRLSAMPERSRQAQPKYPTHLPLGQEQKGKGSKGKSRQNRRQNTKRISTPIGRRGRGLQLVMGLPPCQRLVLVELVGIVESWMQKIRLELALIPALGHR